MSQDIFELWTYLAARPLTGLTVTLAAYFLADALWRRLGRPALLSPVLVAVALVALLLAVTDTPYATYFEGAQFVHFLLGPATVALAVPLYRSLAAVRRSAFAVVVGLMVGSTTAIVSAVSVAWLLGGDAVVLRSLAPKSVTTPVAMAVAEQIGGLPSLTAVLVILTAMVGVVLGAATLSLFRIRDPRARGLALGVSAHGLGTARAFEEGEATGAFSSLGMGLNALLTALIVPLLAYLLS